MLSPNADLSAILQWRAVHQPQQLAYRFLSDEANATTQRLSYAELHRQAQVIAAQLEGMANQPVLISCLAGLDFVAAFYGCLYAGAVAIPVPPPNRHQGLERWQQVVIDAQPRVILASQQQQPKIQAVLDSIAEQISHKILCLDPFFPADEVLMRWWQKPKVDSEAIALLQYTSGSTGQPKGVMISHRNLMHNLALIHKRFGHSSASHGVIWLPPHHDMGLIGGILQPLYGGFPVTLMSPGSFMRQPIRWLRAISEVGGTTSGGPNFAYERCLAKITLEQRQSLDLSCWDLAFTGAEPIRAETLRQFAETFADCGFNAKAFYPCYGLAEATLFVSGGSKIEAPTAYSAKQVALREGPIAAASVEDVAGFISCGQAAADQRVLIVDPQTLQPCPDKQVGEIWLSGPSVAQGYWRQPEATQATFDVHLADGTGSFLRTGDLGFVRNDELFVTGRLKDLIIIRGQNHYPQDIEQTVEQCHEAVRSQTGAALGLEITGEERLIIVQEVKRTVLRSLNASAVIDAIRAAVSRQHQLQVYAVVLLKSSSLPKTTSGKVRRHACKAGFQDGTLAVIGQWSLDETAGELPPVKSLSETTGGAIPRRDEPSCVPPAPAPNDDRVTALLQWLRQYASESINSRLMDERRCISPGVVLDFGNHGLLGMQVPTSYGGLGFGHRDMLRVLEQLGAIDPTLALFVGLNNVLGIRPILQAAHPDIQAEWLPRLATGRELAAFALTEPGAGSNPNAICSKVVNIGSKRWHLQGQKIWSGSAAWAGIINVFVQHPEASGISGFVVTKGTPGLCQGPEALTMGMRGMVQNTIYLDSVPVAETQLLGTAGGGMAIAQDAMMYGRLAIASACIGGMKRCAQLMLRYSSRRTVATGRLLDNPVLLTRLGGLTAKIAALTALINWIAQRLDAGLTVPGEAYTACKILAPEFYWQAADDLVQCLGGRGYIEANLAPQILRDARVLRIFEGPTEALTMYLGAQILDARSQLRAFLIEDLGASSIAEQLSAGAGDILERHHQAQADAVKARRLACSAVGELGAIAILWATLRCAEEANPRALEWTQLYFEQVLAQALKLRPDEVASASAAVTIDWIASYTDTIGDIEQTAAGEDRGLDALLQRDESGCDDAWRSLKDEATVPRQERGSDDIGMRSKGIGTDPLPLRQLSPSAKSLEAWLIQWLAGHLKLAAKAIDPDRAFADYGVDSVMAVELAQDLEEFLQLRQPLDATLAWNFPTIAALATHLATQSTPPASSIDLDDGQETITGALAEPGLSSPAHDSLDHLSEAEIADVLAAELAGMQGG
ncbi:MAG: AMP-binding protein [Cyanobacteria bacterium P01_F01_bin.86]